MWLQNPEKLKEILYRLVNCPSISGTIAENQMSREIYAILSEVKYFQDNPQFLKQNNIKNDKLQRSFISALLKGKGDNTVILLHHYDVVGVDDYGSLKDKAYDPDSLTEAFKDFKLPIEARCDYESGDWLFGRGIMDMKAGATLQIALLHDLSLNDSFEGNILLLSVPGEESNSEGMLAAVPFLNQMKKKYNLEYVAVVNSEPNDFDNSSSEDYGVSIGSIGKLLPVFYCFGKETHAGTPFEGLNSSFLFSQVETLMENNIELCDTANGECSPPPTNLKTKDLKEIYSVTTPQVTVGYYNVFTLSRTPAQVLELLKGIAYESFVKSLNIQGDRLNLYCSLTGMPPKTIDWKPNIYTFDELYKSALDDKGEVFLDELNKFIEELLWRPVGFAL